MALEKLLESVDIIQKLGDNPNTDDNLSPELLKMKFDEAAGILKRYLNEQVVPYINTLDSAFTDSLDPTLTEEKKAAQAKAVGDKISELNDYFVSIAHLYRGEYVGNIDSKELNGVYWIQSEKCTGTFPSAKADYAFLEATKNKQKLINISTNNYKITRIHERVWFNNRWFDWVRTDSIDSLHLSGGTMTGAIAMGGNKITGLGTPTVDADGATKKYIDDLFGGVFNKTAYTGDFRNAPGGTWFVRVANGGCSNYPPNAQYGYLTAYDVDASRLLIYTEFNTQKVYLCNNANGWTNWEPLTMIDQVWSNSTNTSSFAGQTISVNLTEYDYIGIICTYDINGTRRLPIFFCNVGTTTGGFMHGINPVDNAIVGRTVTAVDTSGITFADAYKNGTGDNKVCIPYRILGFKGVF